MGVTRRIIFPTIRLILWAVIAATLVKIAFAGADVEHRGQARCIPPAQSSSRPSRSPRAP